MGEKRKSFDATIQLVKRQKLRETTQFSQLPNEIMLMILEYTDIKTSINLLTCCGSVYDKYIGDKALFEYILRLKLPYEYFNYLLVCFYAKHSSKLSSVPSFYNFIQYVGRLKQGVQVVASAPRGKPLMIEKHKASSQAAQSYFNHIFKMLFSQQQIQMDIMITMSPTNTTPPNSPTRKVSQVLSDKITKSSDILLMYGKDCGPNQTTIALLANVIQGDLRF